ncbi:MAG: hypothetical protein HY077_19175 [Elusimicrobia bacterium]|nr:hypothetical protein [Elusimicrobiota bacterium]
MKNEKTDGGFEYSVTDDAIREHRKLSAWDKLRWLRQANAFISRFASEKAKRLQERFRSGDL